MNATHHGYADDQKKIIARLNRIEGQVRGICQMTENGEYCINILTQISAVNSALKSVALLLVDDLHITEHQGILRPGAIYDRIGPHLLGLGHDIRAIGKRIPVVAPVVDAPVCRQKLVLRVPDI